MRTVKFITYYLTISITLFLSCTDAGKSPDPDKETKSSDIPVELKVGGLYRIQGKDSTHYICKILVIDEFALHIRTYSNDPSIPDSQLSSDKLNILIGHAPLDKNGFLLDKPELLKVEEVKESELEGYKTYIEMNK